MDPPELDLPSTQGGLGFVCCVLTASDNREGSWPALSGPWESQRVPSLSSSMKYLRVSAHHGGDEVRHLSPLSGTWWRCHCSQD
ncbi:unnamed protein product [Boreogadus saida]